MDHVICRDLDFCQHLCYSSNPNKTVTNYYMIFPIFRLAIKFTSATLTS